MTANRHGRILETRLTPQSVALVVKMLTAKQGVQGDYAGHSLRAGLAIAAAVAGVSDASNRPSVISQDAQVYSRKITPVAADAPAFRPVHLSVE